MIFWRMGQRDNSVHATLPSVDGQVVEINERNIHKDEERLLVAKRWLILIFLHGDLSVNSLPPRTECLAKQRD